MLCLHRLYFDKALPLILLYRQEREQYERLRAATSKGKEFVPSDIYGAEHLLRLFVRLPHLLAQTAMGAQEVSQVRHIDSRCSTYVIAFMACFVGQERGLANIVRPRQVQTKLAEFLKFLQKNYSQYFLTLYKKSEELCPPLTATTAPAATQEAPAPEPVGKEVAAEAH